MPHCRPESLLDAWETHGLPFREQPRLLHELRGGRTNRSYLIEADHERWVLRIDSPDSTALGIDRRREHRILAAAHAAGLAPALLCADAARGFIVTAYVDGGHVQPADLSDTGLEELLAVLAGVSRLDADVAPMDYRQHGANYLRGTANTPQLPRVVEARIALLEETTAPGICHHDPVPANVVFQHGCPLLIDWEYAGRGLPILDLAAIVTEWRLPARRIGEATSSEPELLAAACALYADLCRLWEQRAGALQASGR